MATHGLNLKVNGKWIQIGEATYPKAMAVRVFQNAFFEYMQFHASLKPAKKTSALLVVPAYGRDYQDGASVLADWNEEKDFQVILPRGKGTYVNKQQGYPCVCLFDNRSQIILLK